MKNVFLVFIMIVAGITFADTLKSKSKEVVKDTERGAKKVTRTVKDKTCEMINGKMECAAKKVKHSIQNGVDEVEDAVE